MSNRIMDDKGMSLVEVLMAMLLLLFVSLALMQAALLSIDSNMRNSQRDVAVQMAQERMDNVRNTAFATLAAGTTTSYFTRKVRNYDMRYRTSLSGGTPAMLVNTTVAVLNTDNKSVRIDVWWTWKADDYSHSVSSLRYSGD